jgi:hypothetical protein
MATYRTSAAGGGTSGTSNRTATITPAVGDLLIVFCNASGNTNASPTCSDNNGSGVYTLIGTALKNSSADIMSVFVRNTLMVNTISTVVTVATGSNTAAEFIIVAVAGMAKTGSSAVRSSGFQANQAASTTPAPVLSQAALTANVTITCVANGTVTGSVIVPNASWTERQDIAQSTPTTGIEIATRDSGFTGTTITQGGTSSTAFASAAIELDGSDSATLSVTTADATVLSTATVAVLATASVTTDNATLAATGTVAIAATSSMTTDTAVVAATGTVAINATASVTSDDSTIAATATVSAGGINATLSETSVDAVVVATATVAISASASVTSADASVVSTATVAVAATLAETGANASISSAGTVSISGTANLISADWTCSATATVAISAAENKTSADAVLNASATVLVQASASLIEDQSVLSAQATVATGTSAVLLATNEDAMLVSSAKVTTPQNVDLQAQAFITGKATISVLEKISLAEIQLLAFVPNKLNISTTESAPLVEIEVHETFSRCVIITTEETR